MALFQILILFFLPSFVISLAYAEVSTQNEPQYSEAVLAYNGRDYDRAIKILDELEKASPATIEFLELKALAYKSSNRPLQSEKIYTDLLRRKQKEGAPAKALAPYAFELGVLKYNAKNWQQASKLFQAAIRGEFNQSAAHFYLGIAAFQTEDWKTATENLQVVVKSGTDELIPPAHLYLAQCYLKTRQSRGATDHLVQARDTAQRTLQDSSKTESSKSMAQSIFDAATKALVPLSKPQWFGSVSWIWGYDSNILSQPSTSTSSLTSSTGQGSVTSTLQAGIGYMTAPTKTYQLVPSYRLSTNFNLNDLARTEEYVANQFSLYITRDPLAETSYGLKIGTDLTFANGKGSGRFDYGYYSTIASIGPYFKQQLSQGANWGGELFWGPALYADDSQTTSADQKNGWSLSNQFYYQQDQGSHFWNPTLAFSDSYTYAKGSNNTNLAIGLSLSSLMYLNSKLRISPKLSFTRTMYTARSSDSGRTDHLIAIGVSLLYRWNARLSLVGEVNYEDNLSTLESSYAYSKAAATVGASYSLF